MRKIKEEYERIKKIFIVDNGRVLSEEILEILVRNEVRISKNGEIVLLGRFNKLSSKKRKIVEDIAKKLWEIIELKKNSQLSYNDYILLINLEKKFTKTELNENTSYNKGKKLSKQTVVTTI